MPNARGQKGDVCTQPGGRRRLHQIGKMRFYFVLFLVIPAALAFQQPTKKWCVRPAFVQKGLYGLNLTIRRGTEILCDIPAASSPHNTTCNDNQSLVILQSNNSLTLITEAMDKNKTYFLERNDNESTPLNCNGTFDSKEEALKSLQNRTNPILTAAAESTNSNLRYLWLLIIIPIIIPIIIAVLSWIKRRSKEGDYYYREAERDTSNEQLESWITDQPISNTQNHRNGTHSNGVLPGEDISMDFLDSNSQSSYV